MEIKNKKNDTVWTMADYGNLDVAEYLYKLRNGSGSGGGTFGAPGNFSLEKYFPGQNPGVSTIETATGMKPTPAVQSTAQEILKDPTAFANKPPEGEKDSSILDSGKRILGSLFNYEDEKESAIESVWDGFLKGFDWAYDSLTQVTVAGMSALPGGTQTLTWDEAGDVSFGQQLVANMGVSAGKVRRGEGNIFDVGAAGIVGGLAGIFDSDSEIQQKDFDITSEEDRKVFEEGPAKFFSGLADFGFVFADPLIGAGIATKLTRLKYIDRPLETGADLNRFKEELTTGIKTIEDAETSGVGVSDELLDSISPVAKFVETNWGGQTPWRQIAQRFEIKDSTQAEAIAIGISEATTRQEAVQIMLAATGDVDALRYLETEKLEVVGMLKAAERKQASIRAAVEPEKWQKELHTQSVILENSRKTRDKIKQELDQGLASSNDLEAAERALYMNEERYKALGSGISQDPALSYDKAAQEAVTQEINMLAERNKYFGRALELDKALTGTNRSFASNTSLGRAVSRRRERIAEGRYEVMANRGAWSHEDFFTKEGLRRTLRIWKYSPGLENPAYYFAFKGASAVDSSREAGAVMDTLKIFSGEGKVVTRTDAKGNAVQVTVGGREAKEAILRDFVSAIEATDDVPIALANFEEAIKKNLIDYYDLDADIVDDILSRGRFHMNDIAERIKDPARRWFPEDNVPEELATLGKSVFLESQLANGAYLLPYDEIEKIIVNVAEGKVATPSKDLLTKAGKGRLVDNALYTKKGLALERAKAANDLFQDVWRPLVLMRLGYPQRNVSEGLFRSIVFNQSFSPLGWAAKAAGQGAQNVRRAKRAEKEGQKYAAVIQRADGADDPFIKLVDEQTALMEEQVLLGKTIIPDVDLPDTYVLSLDKTGKDAFSSADDYFQIRKEADEWRIYELSNDSDYVLTSKATFATAEEASATLSNMVNEALTKQVDYVSEGRPRFAEINRDYGPGKKRSGNTKERVDQIIKDRDKRINAIEKKLDAINEKFDSLGRRELPTGLKGTKFDNWRNKELDALDDAIEGSVAFEKQAIEDAGGWKQLTPDLQDNIIKLRYMRRLQESQRAQLLKDDYFALSEFTASASRKKRVDVGEDIMLDNGVLLTTAFGNPRYRDIAQKNLSADNTIKATLTSRVNISSKIWLNKVTSMFVDVTPDMGQTYWDGMAEMLQQYAQSKIGQMAAGGASMDEMVEWLLVKDDGRKWKETLDANGRSGAVEYPWGEIGESSISAAKYVQTVVDSLEYITKGDPNVLKIVMARPPKADELKRLMGDRTDLTPVVGNKEEITGYGTTMDMWRKTTEKVFQTIGTLPEDVFVRGPFYAKQYEKSRDVGLAILRDQYGDDALIPIDRILKLETNAHRRALKDTKEFLYTIDRRTNLGRYGEWISPFVSATQNSVTSLGKLTRRDPALPALMLSLWQAPTRVGWEDENGNLIIPLPTDLIPDGVEDFFGIKGMQNINVSKAGLNAIFPETGFAFAPRPTPLVQVVSSELMKKGFLGYDVTPPGLLVSALGKDQADQLWSIFKDYMYGEENGISPNFFSYDKVAPPWMAKAVQLADKSSAQYSYQYALQARTQDLLWRAGERDDYPTSKEIMDRTNGQFLLRMIGNLTAFTPPDYEYPVQALVDMQRKYDKAYGLEGPMKFSEQFGNEVLILANTDTSKNIGGALSNMEAVRNIKNNDELIRGLAPRLGDDLSLLGIIVNENAADAEYDPSSYRWLTTTEIPGTSKNWREILSGPESMRESQRTAGWVEFSKFMGSLDSMLTESGFTSYRVKGAAELNQARREFLDNMKNNPMYEGWRIDYEDIGGKKNEKALMLISSALNNEQFMSNKADNRTWQAAAMYMEARREVMAVVASTGKTINDEDNLAIAEEWDAFRLRLKNYDNGWAAIANRYLNADDDPRGEQIESSLFEGGM